MLADSVWYQVICKYSNNNLCQLQNMVPYFKLERIPILESDSFSFFLLLAFVLGFVWFLRRAYQYGYSVRTATEFFCYTAAPAFFGAHFFHVFAYEPQTLAHDPWILLRLNSGLASYGGILAGFIIFFPYLAITGRLSSWRVWIDAVAQGLIVALFVGRIGCTLIHDHPGIESSFFLAIDYPGGPKHDLGFYELLYLGVFLFPVTLIANRANLRAGAQFSLFAVLYGAFRFLSDSLRIGDAHYLGLTPAQYGSFVLIAFGLFSGCCAFRDKNMSSLTKIKVEKYYKAGN